MSEACAHPLIMPPGVYFGLPDEDYHKALALSASGVKWLRISPLDWWARSPLNENPDDEGDREARIVGTAYHKRILEGRDAFYRCYAEKLDRRDFPDAISTNDEIRQAIKNAGGPERGITSARKDELIAALRKYAPDVIVWDEYLRHHEVANPGKILLSGQTIRRIERAAMMIELHKELSRAFTGGVAEASCFWFDADTGVPMKCRWDYLKIRAIIDLKSAANAREMQIDRAVVYAIASYKLHIQAALYLEGAAVARDLIRRDLVFGKIPSSAFLAAWVDSPGWEWMWIFQMKGPAPVARAYHLPNGITLDLGRREVEEAKILWARHWEVYGTDAWVDQSEMHTIDSTELPSFIIN